MLEQTFIYIVKIVGIITTLSLLDSRKDIWGKLMIIEALFVVLSCLICLFSIHFDTTAFLDAIIILTAIGCITTVSYSHYLEEKTK